MDAGTGEQLELLAASLVRARGDDFFPVLAQHLAGVLGAREAHICEALGGRRVRTLGVWRDDAYGATVEYGLDEVASHGGRLFSMEIDFHPAEMRGKPAELALSGLRGERVDTGFGNAGKFDLDVLFTEDANGLELELFHDIELFPEPLANVLADELLRTLDFLVDQPEQPVSMLAPIERAGSTSARRARLAAVRERSRGPAVHVIETDEAVPPIVELEGEPTFGLRWLGEQRERVEGLLARYGGVLLRGFSIDSPDAFSTLLEACGQAPIPYRERSSPRHTLGTNVYTSTDHPADQEIKLHTEHSYAARWPMRIAFACLRPADEGGATPTADTRRVLASLPAPLIERFSRLGIAYIRNFGGGLGLDWTDAFCTTSRDEVESYCRANGMTCEWLGGKRLRVTWTRPAVRQHPVTGERVWFNHAYFFNVLSLMTNNNNNGFWFE